MKTAFPKLARNGPAGASGDVVALKSDAAAGKSKDRLSRDFWGCSIFDFCNNIGTKRRFARCRQCPELGVKLTRLLNARTSHFDPQRTWGKDATFLLGPRARSASMGYPVLACLEPSVLT
jgi:hypothetical protein